MPESPSVMGGEDPHRGSLPAPRSRGEVSSPVPQPPELWAPHPEAHSLSSSMVQRCDEVALENRFPVTTSLLQPHVPVWDPEQLLFLM